MKTKLVLMLFVIMVLISTAVFATETIPTAIEGETELPETTILDIAPEDIVLSDKFFAGDDIEISEIIDGNVYAIGKNVKVTGIIDTNLFVIAEKLTVENEAKIIGSITAMASEINIDNAEVYDTYLVCDKFNLGFNGYVARDLKVFASEVTLNGRVAKDSYIETNKLILDTDFIGGRNINYTAQSSAVYMERTEDDNKKETTTIPKETVQGEITYTKRDKKIFDKEIKKSVNKILKSNKITNNTTEEEVKSIILSYVFNGFGINTNSELAKDRTSTITIPKVVFYIAIVVFIALIIALVLPIILKLKKTKSEVTEKKK